MAQLSMLPKVVALLVLSHINFAFAQSASGTTPQSATTTSSRAASTYTVQVGVGHQFQPDVIQALPGDIVKFNFTPLNHSVVRAEYKYPCIPYEKTGAGKTGFFSGFQPVTAILDNPPSWSVRINDSDPIFFYCSAPGSCINYQMVGVINPNATTVLATQRDLASKSKFVMQPGDDFPPEAADSDKPATSSSSTTSAATTTVTAGPASASATSTPHKSALSPGAIAGIVVGAVFVLVLAAALMFFIGRSKTLKETVNRQSQMPPFNPQMEQPMYQTGFAPMKSPDFHRQSQVGAYEVTPYGPGHPGHRSMDTSTAYSAGYSTPRDGGSPPPQLQVHGSPPTRPQEGTAEERSPIMGLKQIPQSPVEMFAPVPKHGHEI